MLTTKQKIDAYTFCLEKARTNTDTINADQELIMWAFRNIARNNWVASELEEYFPEYFNFKATTNGELQAILEAIIESLSVGLLKRFETKFNAVNIETGEVEEFGGPVIEAVNIEEAKEKIKDRKYLKIR